MPRKEIRRKEQLSEEKGMEVLRVKPTPTRAIDALTRNKEKIPEHQVAISFQ